jgi:hypothetical protein
MKEKYAFWIFEHFFEWIVSTRRSEPPATRQELEDAAGAGKKIVMAVELRACAYRPNARIVSTMRCMQPAQPSRKASSPAAGSRSFMQARRAIGIEAMMGISLVQELADDDRGIRPRVCKNLPRRGLQRAAHDVDADLLVVVLGLQSASTQKRRYLAPKTHRRSSDPACVAQPPLPPGPQWPLWDIDRESLSEYRELLISPCRAPRPAGRLIQIWRVICPARSM